MAAKIGFCSLSYQTNFLPKEGDCAKSIIITQERPGYYTYQTTAERRLPPSAKTVWERIAPPPNDTQKAYADLRKTTLIYLTMAGVGALLCADIIFHSKMITLRGEDYRLRNVIMATAVGLWTIGCSITCMATNILELRAALREEKLVKLERNFKYSQLKLSASGYTATVLGILSLLGLIFKNSPKISLFGLSYPLNGKVMHVLTFGFMLTSILALKYWDKQKIECRNAAFDLAKCVISKSLARDVNKADYDLEK